MRFDRSASFVDGPVQIHPAAFDLDIGFVSPPGTADRALGATPAFRKINGIRDHPAQNGARRNPYAQFAHDRRQITIAEFKAQIPSDAPDDHVVFEPALREQWFAPAGTPHSHPSIVLFKLQQSPIALLLKTRLTRREFFASRSTAVETFDL